MKRTVIAFGITTLFLIFSNATFAADPDFSGFWTHDRTNSEDMPPGMSKTMTVRQTCDKITFEIDLVKGERVWQTVFAAYRLDGKEIEFESKTPDGSGKVKRTARRTAGGIEFEEATIFDAPSGEVTVSYAPVDAFRRRKNARNRGDRVKSERRREDQARIQEGGRKTAVKSLFYL